jgi:hypothetical protein
VNRYRAVALVLALAGIAFAAFVEYGTPRAADVERSFGWFAYEAGPFVLLAVLAILSPFGRTLAIVGAILLALEAFAYYQVFVLAPDEGAALIYLHKPFYGIVVVAVGVLAGFLVGRARAARE